MGANTMFYRQKRNRIYIDIFTPFLKTFYTKHRTYRVHKQRKEPTLYFRFMMTPDPKIFTRERLKRSD